MKKLIFFVISSLIFTSVFAIWDMSPNKASWNILDHIYLDEPNLSYDYVVFKWILKPNIENISLSCSWDIEHIDSINFNHIFKVNFWDNCDDIEILEAKWYEWKIKFRLEETWSLYDKYTDYPTSYLKDIRLSLKDFIWKNKDLEKQSIYWYKNNLDYIKDIKLRNSFYFSKYLLSIIDSIISWRNQKYSSPVPWKHIVNERNKIPNAGRPYRASYTDWIHHWWDIYWEMWEPVVALDDWVIIRIVDNFKFSDIKKWLVKKWNLTEDRKFLNLDTLRWKQVWLKTLKWDVVFYSHLDEIPSDIYVNKVVNRWEKLWTMWVSWVPELWYKDIHLHFTIHQNPYNKQKAWKHSFLDIMKWRWYFQWESLSSTIKHQHSIFKK